MPALIVSSLAVVTGASRRYGIGVSGRIVVFGATGYTGRLTVEALVNRGVPAVLAGRDETRLRALADRLGGSDSGLEVAVADVARPGAVRGLVARGDALVSTVGPFVRLGDAAVEAAIAAGAWYLDSTGEPPFVRRVFESFGPRASASGAGLVTAFGYDYVPGNLAAALALRDGGERATRVDIGYFVTGGGGALRAASRGTRASLVGVALEPTFAWRGGVREERAGSRTRSFRVFGRDRPGLSIGASEHFALPRLHPSLREVNVYLGWFGAATRPLGAASQLGPYVARVPGVRSGLRMAGERAMRRPGRDPDPRAGARVGSYVVALTFDEAGNQVGEVRLGGGNPYELTGRLLAWGATRGAQDGLRGRGALGPVEAFGLGELEDACADAGLTRR